MLLDVVHVKPQSGYRIQLEFENHEMRIFDVTPYLELGVFRQLKDPNIFGRVFIDGGTIAWPGEIDIAPETLYDDSVPLI